MAMDSKSLDYLICKGCGTQYDVTRESGKDECRICDDPRQFVLPTGQEFTTLRELQKRLYKNTFEVDDFNDRIHHITTEPKFGIGQRAILIQSEQGNILWDCVAYIDDDTITKIKSLGGISRIIISHPHFYTTHLDWAAAFNCPVHTSKEDEFWLNAEDVTGWRRFLENKTEKFPGGFTAIKGGGHFDGSLLLHWKDQLFTADTIFTAQAANNPGPARPGIPSYSFLYSIPNHIPLPPDKIIAIWNAVKPFSFAHTHGVMRAYTVHGPDLKNRILESAKIQIKAEGYHDHAFLQESL